MTRYTDLGRKRTHLEAGFTNEDALPDAENLAKDELRVLVEERDQPETKKRKRAKGKGNGTDAGDAGKANKEEGEEAEIGSSPHSYMKKEKKEKTSRKDVVSRTETRRLKRIHMKHEGTTCFACREKGHPANLCPNVKLEEGDKRKGKSIVGMCYQCGSTQHTLSRCRKPRDPSNPLPFASCFVCSGKGHLASTCPKNKNRGIYPNGGCCKLCEETTHLARDCPLRKQPLNTVVFAGTGREAGADEDDFHTIKRKTVEVDKEERAEFRAINKLDIKVGAMSKTVKSFATAPSAAAKKVVFF